MVIINKNHLYIITAEQQKERMRKRYEDGKTHAYGVNAYEGKNAQEDNKKKQRIFYSFYRLFKIEQWPVGIAPVLFFRDK